MPRKPFTLIPEKMEAVLQAALEEFARYGYSHASTNRICGRAGVSKGALFHNFRSKDNLFLFLVQDGIRTMERVFRAHLDSRSPEAPFQAVFVDSFFVLLNYIRRYPDHYRIYLRLIYDPDIPEKDRGKSREVVRAFSTLISDTIYREGRRRGVLREDLETGLARFLFNTAITRFVELAFFPLRDPGLEVAGQSEQEMRDTILRLYRLLMGGMAGRGREDGRPEAGRSEGSEGARIDRAGP